MRKIEADIAKKILPPHIASRLLEEGIETVVAIDDNNEIVGAAVFYCSNSLVVSVVLLYIYIIPEFRSVENGINLVGYALDIFSVRGIQKVHWDIKASEEDDSKVEFIEKNGFSLSGKQGHFMVYNMHTIRNSTLAKRVGEMDALLGNVKLLNEVNLDQLHEFRKTAENEGHEVFIDGLDPNYACFYLEKDIIKAYYDLRAINKDSIYMVDSYVVNGCNKAHAFPLMISKFLQSAVELATDNTKVMYTLFTPEEYNGIRSVFGDPLVEEVLNIYEKEI